MSLKKVSILAAVLLMLLVINLWDKNKIESDWEKKESAKVVVSIARKDMEQVTLEKLGKAPVVFAKIVDERGEDSWRITQPVKSRADSTTLQDLLVTLSGCKSGAVVSSSGDRLNLYGLEPVETKVILKSATQEKEIRFGLLTSDEANAYAQAGDDPAVFLVPKYIYDAVNKSLFQLRDKDIIDLETYKVDRVSIIEPNRKIDIRKENEDIWMITGKAFPMRARRSVITTFLNDMNAGQVAEFVNDPTHDLAFYGLLEGATEIHIWQEDIQHIVRLGHFENPPHTRLFCQIEGNPHIMVVEKRVFKEAPADLPTLRSKKVIATKSWSVGKIQVVSASPFSTLDLVAQEDKSWRVNLKLTTTDGQKALRDRSLSYTDFIRFYDTLDQLEAANFVADPTKEAAEALKESNWIVSIADQRAIIIESILISREVRGIRFLQRKETGEMMTLHDEDLDAFLDNIKELVTGASDKTPVPMDDVVQPEFIPSGKSK
jgi:Domain of unknown function (DUF4340)